MTTVKTVATTPPPPVYQPKTIQITFGTAAEEHVFYALCNTTAINDIELDGVNLRSILTAIRQNLQQHYTDKSEKFPESAITDQLGKNYAVVGSIARK